MYLYVMNVDLSYSSWMIVGYVVPNDPFLSKRPCIQKTMRHLFGGQTESIELHAQGGQFE